MTDTSKRVEISYPTILMIVGLVLFAVLSSNTIYLLCCLLTCFLMIALLWRNARPGILVFAMMLQWAQVICYVLWMNDLGIDVNRFSQHADAAIVMSCIGLLVMALTISLGLRSLAMPTLEQLQQQARLINEKKIMLL